MNPIQQPLLSSAEINRLIAQAGSGKQQQPQSSKRFSQFGEQPSEVLGSGLDFADRRPYIAGDDPRFIDWRASARSGQTLIRRYNTELNTPSCIVIDRRPSMAFGTRKRLKVTQALRAGITLGTQILQGGDQLACLLLDSPAYWQAAQSGLSAFRQTIQIAARACSPDSVSTSTASWNRISNCIHSHLTQGSRLILISDFLDLDLSAQKALRQLGQQFKLSALQIIDPLEQELPTLNNISLHWGEQQQQISTDLNQRQQLNQKLTQHRQQQAQWFNKSNCKLLQLASNDELDSLHGWH